MFIFRFCRDKQCRKIFTPDTFDFHGCFSQIPEQLGKFPVNRKSRKVSESEEESSDKGSDDESDSESDKSDGEEDEDETPLLDIVTQMTNDRLGVCVGYEVTDGHNQCNMCDYFCSFRGNLHPHIRSHGITSFEFCKKPREQSTLDESQTRGCRKIFTIDSFQYHTCTNETEDKLGDFAIGGPGRKSKKKRRRSRQPKYGTPDGTPAKFYCDGYTKLFHRLAAKDGHSMGMDATFLRNGQLELVYLTAGQLKAVREFCWGSDKYFLVGLTSMGLIGRDNSFDVKKNLYASTRIQ